MTPSTSAPRANGASVTAGATDAADASTADRLLSAAADAFAAKGFHATTTRDIAAGAGLSPAGVYVYFGSKEDLLFSLSKAGHEAAIRLIEDAVASADSPVTQLTAVMSRFTEWHVVQYQVARVVQHEHSHLTPAHHADVLALRKQIDALVRDILERGVASGEFDIDDLGDTALALLSMVVDVARWYSPTIKRSPEQIGATNAALALRLVGAA